MARAAGVHPITVRSMETDYLRLRDLKGRARRVGLRIDERKGLGCVLYQLNGAQRPVNVDARTAYRSLDEVAAALVELGGRRPANREKRSA
jgi:hypothetical protein